jgi:uncharacterized membrane protein
MSRQLNDLTVVSVSAVVCAVLTQLAPALPLLGLLCALPLVLFLPGYALSAALFPRRFFGPPERLLLSLGLSLIIVALSGLVLHWLGWSLQAGTWAIVLSGLTVCASAIAWWRRKRNQSADDPPPKLHFNLSRRDSVLLGLALLVVVAAIGLARMPTPPKGVTGYTLLWMIPAGNGNANDYRLGVNSMEFSPASYRLQVLLDGQVIREWPEIQLAPGKSWEIWIVLQADRVGVGSVEATLYRLDNPDVVYRHVKLQRSE